MQLFFTPDTMHNFFAFWGKLIDTLMSKLYPIQDITTLPYMPPVSPTLPVQPVIAPETITSSSTPKIAPQVLLWATPKDAFHSTRVMCDDAGLSYDDKNEICYTIWGESEFHIRAIGKPNKNGTRDFGICQFNDGKNAKGIPLWIGEGATFKDTNEVLTNPEKCVRVMIQTYKAGHIGWWYGHQGYALSVIPTHPMWALKS